jgi:lipid-A-disaccharide synthase
MPKGPHILMVAGDVSSDRLGADLVEASRRQNPQVRVSAMGGLHLKRQADSFLYPLVGLGGFGFWEPLMKLPGLWRAWRAIREILDKDRPDVVVPMDYYGFNIHVARAAHRQGIPVLYYISPQVWASRPYRLKRLAAVIQKMLVLFPFEANLYRDAGVPVSFVGHPLQERLPAPGEFSRLPTIGLLPGSRRGVIRRHLPLLVETAKQLKNGFPELRCVLFRPEEMEPSFYGPFLGENRWIELTTDPTYAERQGLWVAIGVSGTAALENMMLGIPMVVMYRLSRLTYCIARRLIRVPYVAIPNLLAGRAVVRELLQEEATPDNLARAASDFLRDPAKREQTKNELLSLRAMLQGGGSAMAAEEVLRLAGVSASDGHEVTA